MTNRARTWYYGIALGSFLAIGLMLFAPDNVRGIVAWGIAIGYIGGGVLFAIVLGDDA